MMACRVFGNLACCRERNKKPAGAVNQHGQQVAKGIDDALSGQEDEEEEWAMWGGEPEDSSGSDIEVDEEVPVTFERKRANAVSAEAYGPCNPRKVVKAKVIEKTPAQNSILKKAFRNAALFKHLADEDLEPISDAMSVETFQPGDCICRQGSPGNALFVLLEGAVDLHKAQNDVASADPTDTTADNKNFGELLKTLDAEGALFGELALLWNMPRSLSVVANTKGPCVLGRLERVQFQELIVRREMEKREHRAENLRNVKLLEMMDVEQIAKLAEALKLRTYNDGEKLITQGEPGREFFVLTSGECKTTVATYFLGIVVDEQEHRRYHAGELFGELALLRETPRAASVTACVDQTQALVISRGKFERLLGKMSQLQEDQYLTDPRKLIADFYQPGNDMGSWGAMTEEARNKFKGLTPVAQEKQQSSWFVVYRPTSRDAIAKMLSGTAVGKGLNVKGKSAKKGVLSGFVPFLQISLNEDKVKVEASPPGSRIHLYYRSERGREQALTELQKILDDAAGQKLQIDDRKIKLLDSYKPDVFGLELPEPLLKEAYIMQPDIVPHVGWESGRASEPAFMDMNLHAVRDVSEPKVVLYQFDEAEPMNPRGLLIAYAEQYVKPVVSDFDTFTVGSTGVKYEPLPTNQAGLQKWSLDHARVVISQEQDRPWTSCWLDILKVEAEKGFHPVFPKYGYGDPTSYRLIGDVVKGTVSCGAVRHGAECFNFYFPQELDPEYLVVWDGFPDKPWDYVDERALRRFLTDRAEDGFLFPLNPVWPVRDQGWYEVLQTMRKNPEAADAMKAWYPEFGGPDAGKTILSMIDEIRNESPEGFRLKGQEHHEAEPKVSRKTADMFGDDVIGHEKAEAAMHQIHRMSKLQGLATQVKALNSLHHGGDHKHDETAAKA